MVRKTSALSRRSCLENGLCPESEAHRHLTKSQAEDLLDWLVLCHLSNDG
jgi:hypothetical protein